MESVFLTVKGARPRCTRPVTGGENVTVWENATLGEPVFTFEGFDRDGDKFIFTPVGSTGPFSFNKKIDEEILKVNGPLDFETERQYIFQNI